MSAILENTLTQGYAQGAFNFTCFPQLKAILETHEIFHSPAIVEIGGIALGYLGNAADMNNATLEEKTRGAENVIAMLKQLDPLFTIPVAIHADHVKDLATIKMLVDKGFTSVMIDGSHLSFEENAELTREVVRLAHPHGVTVEAELGILAGTEDKIFSEESTYTNPLKVVDFIKKTGADCLALSYGTKHGVKKGLKVKLRREIVIAAAENLRHERLKAVLVSHGSSTVPAYLVEDINALGGKLEGVGGIPPRRAQGRDRLGDREDQHRYGHQARGDAEHPRILFPGTRPRPRFSRSCGTSSRRIPRRSISGFI